jgi:hypothetical protein
MIGEFREIGDWFLKKLYADREATAVQKWSRSGSIRRITYSGDALRGERDRYIDYSVRISGVVGLGKIREISKSSFNTVSMKYMVKSSAKYSGSVPSCSASQVESINHKYPVKARFNLAQGYIEITSNANMPIASTKLDRCFKATDRGKREFFNTVDGATSNMYKQVNNRILRRIQVPYKHMSLVRKLDIDLISKLEEAIVTYIGTKDGYSPAVNIIGIYIDKRLEDAYQKKKQRKERESAITRAKLLEEKKRKETEEKEQKQPKANRELQHVDKILETFAKGDYNFLKIDGEQLYSGYKYAEAGHSIPISEILNVGYSPVFNVVRINCKNDKKCAYGGDFEKSSKLTFYGNSKTEVVSLYSALLALVKEMKKPNNTSNIKTYTRELNELNDFLKTFDGGYYGPLSISKGLLYCQVKGYGKSSIELSGISKVTTKGNNISLVCKQNSFCYKSTSGAAGKNMSFSSLKPFNKERLSRLLNNLLAEIKR